MEFWFSPAEIEAFIACETVNTTLPIHFDTGLFLILNYPSHKYDAFLHGSDSPCLLSRLVH